METLSEAPVPESAEGVEMDELYSFIGSRKQNLPHNLY